MSPDDIKTEAGKKLFNLMNMLHGSIVWGPILEGILAIEKEMGNDIPQTPIS